MSDVKPDIILTIHEHTKPIIYKVLLIPITIHVSTASAERSFSVL